MGAIKLIKFILPVCNEIDDSTDRTSIPDISLLR